MGRGAFVNYHTETLVGELATIPQPDRGALYLAMDRYAKGDRTGFTLRNYGAGLLMVKKDRLSGRALFSHDEETGPRPVLLLAYKKESDEAPSHIIVTARERRGRWIEARRRNG